MDGASFCKCFQHLCVRRRPICPSLTWVGTRLLIEWSQVRVLLGEPIFSNTKKEIAAPLALAFRSCTCAIRAQERKNWFLQGAEPPSFRQGKRRLRKRP
jgi:hypothetical protein